MRLLDPRDYTVLWIAPLEIEARAAKLFLDHHHLGVFESDDSDDHVFYAGDICGFNIIIGSFPTGQVYGISSATSLVKEARSRFPELKFGLLVGVAAGIARLDQPPLRDIRLGDVLVAVPVGEDPAVIPYELGKDVDGGELQLLRCGYSLNEVPKLFRSGIGSIKLKESEITVRFYREAMEQQLPDHTFDDPGQDKDPRCSSENNNGQDLGNGQRRSAAARTQVWYGTIGSGDKLIKNALTRDKLRDKHKLIGLEMEAAGVMNHLPTAVIRGVSDYADKHKNKTWQPYAAAMAAAYTKAVLAHMPRRQTRPNDRELPQQ